MKAAEPLVVGCEGAGAGPCGFVFGASNLGMCAMCGQIIALTVRDGEAVMSAHDRPDVLAMLDRGDYG